jgi:hypothetical protein
MKPYCPKRQAGGQVVRSFGHDVDGSANRVCAVHRGAGARYHLDALDAEDRGGDVTVVVPALAVVQAPAVNHDEHLTERRAPNRKICLNAERTAGSNIDARGETHRIRQVSNAEACQIGA